MSAETAEVFDPVIPPALAAYGFAHFVVALAASFVLLLKAESMPALHVAAGGFYVAGSLAGIGGVFEAARWAAPHEVARVSVLAAASMALAWAGAIPVSGGAAGVAFCLVSLAWLLPNRGALTEAEIAPLM